MVRRAGAETMRPRASACVKPNGRAAPPPVVSTPVRDARVGEQARERLALGDDVAVGDDQRPPARRGDRRRPRAGPRRGPRRRATRTRGPAAATASLPRGAREHVDVARCRGSASWPSSRPSSVVALPAQERRGAAVARPAAVATSTADEPGLTARTRAAGRGAPAADRVSGTRRVTAGQGIRGASSVEQRDPSACRPPPASYRRGASRAPRRRSARRRSSSPTSSSSARDRPATSPGGTSTPSRAVVDDLAGPARAVEADDRQALAHRLDDRPCRSPRSARRARTPSPRRAPRRGRASRPSAGRCPPRPASRCLALSAVALRARAVDPQLPVGVGLRDAA